MSYRPGFFDPPDPPSYDPPPPPDECPACGEPNSTREGALLDEAEFTCGHPDCKADARKVRESLERAEAEMDRDAAKVEAAWIRRLAEETP